MPFISFKNFCNTYTEQQVYGTDEIKRLRTVAGVFKSKSTLEAIGLKSNSHRLELLQAVHY